MTTQWIATRSLLDENDNSVEVRIGAPEQGTMAPWQCPVQIGNDPVAHAYGEDAMQAIMLGFQKLRVELEKRGRFRMFADSEPGWIGFPATIPDGFGLAFYRRMEQHIEGEIAKDLKERQARAGVKP